MSHLTKQERCIIENLLNAKISLQQIGVKVNKNHSTIAREIKKHRIEDENNKKRKKNFCTLSKSWIFFITS